MKILIVDVYGATRSTGKITSLQYRELKKRGHDVRVCYRGVGEPRIDNSDFIPLAGRVEPGVGRLLAWLTGYEGYVHPLATKKLIKITKEFYPDIVQLNILHGYYINSNQYITFLKENHYPVCYTMMDEYAYMGKCPYSFSCNQFKEGCKGHCPEKRSYPKSYFFDRSEFLFEAKRKAYSEFEKIVFTGPGWVVDRAKCSALLRAYRIEELDEPVEFGSVFYPRDTAGLRKKLEIPEGNKVIVTVAQMSNPRKGGSYFIKVAELMARNKDITFVFVGYDISEPIHIDNLITIPYVDSQNELAEYYSLGDLFVCTSLADTMPNVCIDALGCGTPLAGFAEAGTPYVASPEYGEFTKTYDLETLSEVILKTPRKTKERVEDCRQYALNRYSGDVIIDKQEKIYQSLLEKK
jgi:glycosyltransferase involved in cell wall biosynthesis